MCACVCVCVCVRARGFSVCVWVWGQGSSSRTRREAPETPPARAASLIHAVYAVNLESPRTYTLAGGDRRRVLAIQIEAHTDLSSLFYVGNGQARKRVLEMIRWDLCRLQVRADCLRVALSSRSVCAPIQSRRARTLRPTEGLRPASTDGLGHAHTHLR
jgi:hypothetical protein